jgi:hypothetical protein
MNKRKEKLMHRERKRPMQRLVGSKKRTKLVTALCTWLGLGGRYVSWGVCVTVSKMGSTETTQNVRSTFLFSSKKPELTGLEPLTSFMASAKLLDECSYK